MSVATVAPQARVVSLETLAQAKLETALADAEIALKYIERLYDEVDDSGEQYAEFRALTVASRQSIESLQSVESALFHAVKDGGPIDFRP
jgi:hypothetical protein